MHNDVIVDIFIYSFNEMYFFMTKDFEGKYLLYRLNTGNKRKSSGKIYLCPSLFVHWKKFYGVHFNCSRKKGVSNGTSFSKRVIDYNLLGNIVLLLLRTVTLVQDYK